MDSGTGQKGTTEITAAIAGPEFRDWDALHVLLSEAFAGMAGRIDPPSSLTRMTPVSLSELATRGSLVLARTNGGLVGCAFAQPDDGLYLSKIAVSPELQGRGVLRLMLGVLVDLGKQDGAHRLWLQTRVELTETHAAFRALGFRKRGETCHPGYERVTSLTFELPL